IEREPRHRHRRVSARPHDHDRRELHFLRMMNMRQHPYVILSVAKDFASRARGWRRDDYGRSVAALGMTLLALAATACKKDFLTETPSENPSCMRWRRGRAMSSRVQRRIYRNRRVASHEPGTQNPSLRSG